MEHLPKKSHQNGISYTLVGDYYIPDLKLPEESRPIGRWGRMHKAFLQEHRPGQYNALLLSGKLWTYLADLNEQAVDRLACMRIAKQLMDDKVPITRVKSNTECDVNYYAWGGARISHILRNPFYKGAHLVCRTHQKGIRFNTYDIIPREDWEIIEDCHEAIVFPEEWEHRPPRRRCNREESLISIPPHNTFGACRL